MQPDDQGFVYVMPEWIPVQLDDPFLKREPVQALWPAAAAREPGTGNRLSGHALLPLRHDGAELGVAVGGCTRDVSLVLLRRLRDGEVYDQAGRFM